MKTSTSGSTGLVKRCAELDLAPLSLFKFEAVSLLVEGGSRAFWLPEALPERCAFPKATFVGGLC